MVNWGRKLSIFSLAGMVMATLRIVINTPIESEQLNRGLRTIGYFLFVFSVGIVLQSLARRRELNGIKSGISCNECEINRP